MVGKQAAAFQPAKIEVCIRLARGKKESIPAIDLSEMHGQVVFTLLVMRPTGRHGRLNHLRFTEANQVACRNSGRQHRVRKIEILAIQETAGECGDQRTVES